MVDIGRDGDCASQGILGVLAGILGFPLGASGVSARQGGGSGRPCPGCGRPVTWRSTRWCSPGCRTKFYCDHQTLPTVAPGPETVAAHQRLVVAIEVRFRLAKLALRRASSFTVDPWAQRPGAGRAMEDWGSEK